MQQGCFGAALLVTVLVAVLVVAATVAGAPQTDEQWRIVAEVQRLRVMHGTVRVGLVVGALVFVAWLWLRVRSRRHAARYLPHSPQFDSLFYREGGYYVDNRPMIEGRAIRYLEVDDD